MKTLEISDSFQFEAKTLWFLSPENDVLSIQNTSNLLVQLMLGKYILKVLNCYHQINIGSFFEIRSLFCCHNLSNFLPTSMQAFTSLRTDSEVLYSLFRLLASKDFRAKIICTLSFIAALSIQQLPNSGIEYCECRDDLNGIKMKGDKNMLTWNIMAINVVPLTVRWNCNIQLWKQ